MKKFFTLILFCLTAISTWAYDVEVDGVYYELVKKMAWVTSGSNKYSGSVDIPETIVSDGVTYSVTEIRDKAFYNCSGLTSVAIGNSVTSIGQSAFHGCSGLTSVTIGKSVTSIGNDAFTSCSSLSELIYNAKNPTVSTSESQLLFPKTLKKVVIGDEVESIPAYFIYENTGVTSITIPNSVTSIGDYAFNGCSGLTKVNIPNSVTSIGMGVFASCSGLTYVTIPNSVTSIGIEAFYECYKLTSVTIPNSVTSIGIGAFTGCSGLTSVTIPNSVTKIQNDTFSCCSGIKTVSIGTGIRSIGHQAFAICKNIETVTCYAEKVPTMGAEVFNDSYVSYSTLKVLEASVDLYKAADQWKEFGSILPIEDTGIKDVMLTPCSVQIYNISGQRAKDSDKGILIRDGKKYINK